MPSKAELLSYIEKSTKRLGKRDLARAFKVSGQDKPAFKALLKELEQEGAIERSRRRKFAEAGRLPGVAVIDAVRVDADGDLIGHPANWDEKAPPPLIYIDDSPDATRGIGVGDRILARLSPTEDGTYQASPIRKLTGGPRQILGICERTDDGHLLIKPIDRRERDTIRIDRAETKDAQHGEFVLVAVEHNAGKRVKRGRILERIREPGIDRALSLIAVHSHGIPHEWPAAALEEAEACGPAELKRRTDLRDIPLVTIDGEDARDFDDAVWAEPDSDPKNRGGWHLIVAIADVAHYVRPNSGLDRAAFDRGNSTYFPDRVVPMLPEALSNGWCSLRPGEDRPCLAVHIWIRSDGRILRHQFVRGLMRSVARLTYTQVQAAHDGSADLPTKELTDTVIEPLYGAYKSLMRARRKRGALALDLPERKITIDENGHMTGVQRRPRWGSHELIEEFMIAANIVAAQALLKDTPTGLYRVHEPPDGERVNDLRSALQSMDLSFGSAGSVKAKDFNRVLEAISEKPAAGLINMMILRAQSQARYEPENLGHFGLALPQYTHFTSPIRRYSDLVVHRCLISKLKLGKDGPAQQTPPNLQGTAEHISMTERRSAVAERETVDRFTAAYLKDRVGATFDATVNGVSRFGLFVTLDETGADGIVPIKRLPNDYYEVFEDTHTLAGRNNGVVFSIGDPMTVRLSDADPLTGSIAFDYLDHTPQGPKPSRGRKRGPSRHRRGSRGKRKTRAK